MTVRRWTPSGVPTPLSKYSQLAGGEGRTIYISGQVGIDGAGTLAGATLAAQTRQVFANIEALLEAEGARPEHLVKLLTFVVGPADVTDYRAVRDEVYERWFPAGDWPANSLAFVAGLARPDLLIEMEGVVIQEPQQ